MLQEDQEVQEVPEMRKRMKELVNSLLRRFSGAEQMNWWTVRWSDLQQVPSLQNVHEVQEVRWVRADHSYHPYQENQQIRQGPAHSTEEHFKVTESLPKHLQTWTMAKIVITR